MFVFEWDQLEIVSILVR